MSGAVNNPVPGWNEAIQKMLADHPPSDCVHPIDAEAHAVVEHAPDAAPDQEQLAPAATDAPVGERFGDWMQTFTGRQFWPMDPRTDEVFIEDIAHSLAMQTRYAGHCLQFYSVAEHSVHVARWLQKHYGHKPAVVLKGLLHDAPEAYLVDVPRPVKPFLPGYKEAEARIWKVIANNYGLSDAMPDEVHEADNRILCDERAQNMAPCEVPWNLVDDPLGVTLEFWSPEDAEAMFLDMFDEITGYA